MYTECRQCHHNAYIKAPFSQKIVVEALQDEAKDPHKFSEGIKWARKRATDFHVDERRKVHDIVIIFMYIHNVRGSHIYTCRC